MQAMQQVLDFLQKYKLFDNLKKCQFYKNKVGFLSYIILVKKVKIKAKKIKVVKNWPRLMSVEDIQ